MTHTYPNDDFFDRFEALTFDDVVVVPGWSETLPDAVDTSATFARDIELAVPLVSAAMDKVTEGRMAVAMARHGGIGVIHRNMSITDQAAEVQKVKRSQSGMITDPVTLPPTALLQDAEDLMAKFKFSGVPITDPDGRLVGILTNRDIRFCEGSDFERPVTEFMTADGLVTAEVGTSLDQAKAILQQHRIEKLPLVDDEGRLAGLITVKDIQKRLDFPNASRDGGGRLRCRRSGRGRCRPRGTRRSAHRDGRRCRVDRHRPRPLGQRGQGNPAHQGVVARSRRHRRQRRHRRRRRVAGQRRCGRRQGGRRRRVDLHHRVVSGAGMPQLSAIWFASKRGRELGIPIIADGGITFSGDIVKAIVAGASTVMLGSLLAGTEESPGEMELFEGRRYKSYRGMGSMGAMTGDSQDRYATGQSSGGTTAVGAGSNKLVPEGIEGRVPYAGPLGEVAYQLVGGLRSGMGYAGAATLDALRSARLMRVTTAGREESHPHDVTITKEAPNYQRS